MTIGKIFIFLSIFTLIIASPDKVIAEEIFHNAMQCSAVVKELNQWSRKHGYTYTYKIKDTDTIEVSTLSSDWCRIIAIRENKKVAEVSYTLKNKNRRAASEIDAYFQNSVEHAQIFPLAISDWCRGVGCVSHKTVTKKL